VGGKEGSYFVSYTPHTVWVGKRVPTLCHKLLIQYGWERGFLLCVINSSYSVVGKKVPTLCNQLLLQCGWERGFLICVINSSYSVGGKEGAYFV
jgi:hypothetical protein